jgi:hypothetical protein
MSTDREKETGNNKSWLQEELDEHGQGKGHG